MARRPIDIDAVTTLADAVWAERVTGPGPDNRSGSLWPATQRLCVECGVRSRQAAHRLSRSDH